MKKIYRLLCRIEEALCGIGFLFLIFFVFLSAILRFFRVSMSWNIDLSMLLLAWTAFLGADVAWRSDQIIGVDLFTRRLGRTLRSVIDLAVLIVILIALCLITVYGARLAWSERIATYQSMPIPYSLVTLSLITAAFSMVFTTLRKIRRNLLSLMKKEQL